MASTFTTLVVIRELSGGACLLLPLGDPALAAFGDEEACLADARGALPKLLAKAPAETAARFALPEDTRLHVVDVALEVPDGPVLPPIAVTAVVIPARSKDGAVGDEAWVFLLGLRQTFYLRRGEDLDERVIAEAKRVVAAGELGPFELLALLPGRVDRLEPITLSWDAEEEARAGVAALERALVAAEKRRAAFAVLEAVGTALHLGWETSRERGVPLVGRDDEVARLARVLSGKERLPVLVTGEPAVGKTAVFRAAWEALAKDRGGPAVYATSGARMIAGMSGLGQWQERVRRVMEAAETLDAVLYLDDVADLFSDRESSSVDLPGALKAYLDEGRVRVVGELDGARVDALAARAPQFFAPFLRLPLAPLDAAAARTAVAKLAAFRRSRGTGDPPADEAAVSAIVELSDRFPTHEAFPGRAVRLYRDIVGTRTAVRAADAKDAPLTVKDVVVAFSRRTGIPSRVLRDDEALSPGAVREALARRVVGQEEAVRVVADVVAVAKANLGARGKPLASLLFVGPTGVGKTELARSLAAFLFGDEARLVRLDMSEYGDAWAAERLFRTADGRDGALSRAVRQKPFSVVLLDEIEKAHASVMDVLLAVAGEGRLSDGRGAVVPFDNTILVMTSNLGATDRRARIGLGDTTLDDTSVYLDAVRRALRPEMQNRLDRIVPFRSLTSNEAEEVTRIALRKLTARRGLAESGVSVEIGDEVIRKLAADGFSPAYGARSLRRHVEARIGTPIARLLARSGRPGLGASIAVGTNDVVPTGGVLVERHEGLVFALAQGKARGEARPSAGMSALSAFRREVAGWLGHEAIVSARERSRYLAAELATMTAKTPSDERARASARHHELTTALAAADAVDVDARDLEELGMSALFRGEDLAPLVALSEAARADASGPLFRALVAERRRRPGVILRLVEMTEGAMRPFLAPLAADLERRGWRARLHLAHAKGERWPAARPYGPPRDLADALADGLPQAALLVLEGAHACELLSLEVGLQRTLRAGANPAQRDLMISAVAPRTTLTEREWIDPALGVPAFDVQNQWRRATPVRKHDLDAGVLELSDKATRLRLGEDERVRRLEEIALLDVRARGAEGVSLDPSWLVSDEHDDVRRLLDEDRFIDAIRLYREKTGSSLVEAKLAVEAMRGE